MELLGSQRRYILPIVPSTLLRETAGIFYTLGLTPKYVLPGQKYYDIKEKIVFQITPEQDLTYIQLATPKQFLYLPSIDDILTRAVSDGIYVSFFMQMHTQYPTYRTYIQDTKYPELLRKYAQNHSAKIAEAASFFGVQVLRYASQDPWVAVAFPVARVYAARLAQGGTTEAAKTTEQQKGDR